MQILTEQDLAFRLDDGFRPIPLAPSAEPPVPAVGLTVAIVARTVPDPAAGSFVVLRDGPPARVYLGCAVDADNQPQEWLELWVQNIVPADAARERFSTNALRDAQWRELCAALRAGEPGSVLATPLERGHLPPAVLDLEAGRFVPLTAPDSGQPLRLCTDERLLTDAGLPSYEASVHRYLFAPGAGDPAAARFVRLDADAPGGPRVLDLPADGGATLGLHGPALLVRKFAPLSLEEFADAAGGQAWKGVDNARRIFHVPGVYRLLEDEDAMRCGEAHLFSTAQGQSGRLGEALYLKLQAARQAFGLVRALVGRTQLPLLNLTADSFRVRLGATGLGLPFLWTAQTSLVRPGAAYALPLRNTAVRYFQSVEELAASVYRPGFVGMSRRGTAHVRIRKVFAPTAEGIALEGTIRSAERLSNDTNDLLSIHLPLGAGRADLYGHLDFTEARSEGEAVFRTVPQTFAEPVAAALPGIEGSVFSQLDFEILSPLSTPFDLYSLGVLTLRLLLAGERNPLPEVVDRAFSLAHEAAKNPGAAPLEDRIATAYGADARWRESLGYHHALHTAEGTRANDASLPPRLWWSTLSLVLRLFPRLLPESFCKGYGDAPALALEAVFNEPIRELDALLLRWRAFLLGSWRQNQEVARVIGSIGAEF